MRWLLSYLGTGKGYIHECKDQLSMMSGACKNAVRLRNPDQTAAVVRKAIQEALTAPTGPVTLEIPIDYQSVIMEDLSLGRATNFNTLKQIQCQLFLN